MLYIIGRGVARGMQHIGMIWNETSRFYYRVDMLFVPEHVHDSIAWFITNPYIYLLNLDVSAIFHQVFLGNRCLFWQT